MARLRYIWPLTQAECEQALPSAQHNVHLARTAFNEAIEKLQSHNAQSRPQAQSASGSLFVTGLWPRYETCEGSTARLHEEDLRSCERRLRWALYMLKWLKERVVKLSATEDQLRRGRHHLEVARINLHAERLTTEEKLDEAEKMLRRLKLKVMHGKESYIARAIAQENAIKHDRWVYEQRIVWRQGELAEWERNVRLSKLYFDYVRQNV